MANTKIRLRSSGVTGNIPSSLQFGELALNYADGKLFFKRANNQISSFDLDLVGIQPDSFATINSNSTLILATSPTDTLSIVAGNNVSISTNSSSKTITINALSDDIDQIVSDIANKFTRYSDFPIYSSEFKIRSKRFNLLDQDIYIDPFYALAIIRMDDYMEQYIRRDDPTTVKEIEMYLILDKINLKNFPAAFLAKCIRGKDLNGIPKYDWECGIITAINKALKFLEYKRDLNDIKSHGFDLTYTTYDYANSK